MDCETYMQGVLFIGFPLHSQLSQQKADVVREAVKLPSWPSSLIKAQTLHAHRGWVLLLQQLQRCARI